MEKQTGFPNRREYSFWPDLKHLARVAIRNLTTQPLAKTGQHTFNRNHLPQPPDGGEAFEPIVGYPDAETEFYDGQLFEGDFIDDCPTLELEANETNAHLWDNVSGIPSPSAEDRAGQVEPYEYRHAFDSRPTRIHPSFRVDL